MIQQDIATTERKTLSVRAGSSRKLLSRKALEKGTGASAWDADGLENSFPAEPATQDHQHQEPKSALSSAPAAVPAQPPAWSSEDEAALQALLGRRRAAGYQRRGKDVRTERLRPGEIVPNPNTVVATIVSIVAERGELGRAELLDLMTEASFPHPKARSQSKEWCQGYVAGAIRNGFLAVVADASIASSEPSACLADDH